MKTILRFFIVLGFILISPGFYTFSQVSINTDDSNADPSSMLEVKSTNKGFLPPRVELTAINSAGPITSPATGLLVYNTSNAGTSPNNVTPGYYYWNGTRWISVTPPQGTNSGDMLYWNGTQWVAVPLGSPGQFLRLSETNMPTWSGAAYSSLTTTAASSIAVTTATSGGNITNDGGATVTARGVCWSTSANPTIANNFTTDGSGTGEFVSNLTGLTVNTFYYVRAYATNSVGTAYGNEVSFTTLSFSIGQSYGGGIIFYIDGTGQHGLIAATSDQSANAVWGCSGTLISGTSSNIGTGQANTTAIVSGCSTAGIAARICNDLELNGYSDWFLPSKDELNQMYTQKNVIGGFVDNLYWSSTEKDDTNSWCQHLTSGGHAAFSKGGGWYVRAIRAF